jgi:tRNA dimethylallyltransferase
VSLVSLMSQRMPPLLVLAGATATGKTGISIRLAEALIAEGVPVEIVSADSRQVYRGLDIGTAKVGPDVRARVLHHGLDLADPDEAFSVADFADHARRALAQIATGGGLAILVGGTGLYLRAVARGIDTDALPSDPARRAEIEQEIRSGGVSGAADRLNAIAPGLWKRIDRQNPRRVARALEIATLRGDVPLPAARGYPGPVAWIGLTVERELHRRWIAARAREQFDAGLVEEARGLRERYDPTLPAFSAIGYREAWALIDGTMTRDASIEEDARRNVAFARRQRTWFRAEPEVRWLDANGAPLGPALEAARGLLDRASRPVRADRPPGASRPTRRRGSPPRSGPAGHRTSAPAG